MEIKHNKKRNTGLLQEWFARYIAGAILDGRDQDLQRVKKVLGRAFKPGSDLAREGACFEALYQGEGKFKTREGAKALLERIRGACGVQSQANLDAEKDTVLLEVGKLPRNEGFFSQQVRDYKTHVTIQVLLNHWRATGTHKNSLLEVRNLSDISLLEDQLLEHLTKRGEETQKEAPVLGMTPGDIDHLVVKIMTEKVNTKFQGLLPDQKKIINLWVFKDQEKEREWLVETLTRVRNSTIGLIDWSKSNEKQNLGESLVERLGEVRGLLDKKYQGTVLQDLTLTEDDISFFLEVCQLRAELLGSAGMV